VRLYEAGVGYFERTGKLGAGSDLSLFVPPTHLDDALKTLVVLGDPAKTTVSGIEFAHAYRSATEAARVGGDFYDLFELSHGLLGITVGDVAGKGLDAAVLTSLAKNTIRAHANEKGKTPAQILTLTNDVVYRSTVTEAFVTVFFGLLDCRDGRLVYANAGHTATAVVGADGNVRPLAATGPILGAFADMKFEQRETCLALEELLFLYTDGLTEARRDGEMYGEARLFDFLGATDGRRADELISNVLADVLHFSGNMLRDDLAIMAIRRVEEAD
jgi:serine phosphatase RsbU (regulator of sigma subunit)